MMEMLYRVRKGIFYTDKHCMFSWKEKMSLSMHAFVDWILVRKKKKARCLRKLTPFLLHFQLHAHFSHLHTHPCYQLCVWREGRAGSSAVKWVQELSHEVKLGWTFQCCHWAEIQTGQEWFYIKGDFFLKERRADTSSTVSYIFECFPPTLPQQNTSLKPDRDTESCWHEDRDCGKRLKET